MSRTALPGSTQVGAVAAALAHRIPGSPPCSTPPGPALPCPAEALSPTPLASYRTPLPAAYSTHVWVPMSPNAKVGCGQDS